MKKFLLLSLGTFLAGACLPLDEETDISFEQEDIYHGILDVGAGGYQALTFTAENADSILGAASATSGNFEFFWADEANFGKWLSGDTTAVLHDHQSSVSEINISSQVPSDGSYRAVFASTGSSVQIYVRLKLRRQKQ